MALALLAGAIGGGMLITSPAMGQDAAARLPAQVVERDGRAYAGEGWLERRDGITVVHFKGTHRQIGAQNYLLLAGQSEELRAVFDPTVQPHKGWDRLVWAFKQAYLTTKIAPSLLRHTPQPFIEEMEGFIEVASGGSDRDVLPVLLGNVFQEIGLVYGGCTSFAAFGPRTAGGRLLHGRNLDALDLQDVGRHALVAIYEPEGVYPFITVTYPANVGVMQGMNVHGITVSMDYSFATADNLTVDGTAFMFLLRQVLEQAATLDEAVEMIRKAPRTVGLAILVADGKIPDARVIEVAADRYQVRRPEEGAIWATNRYETPFMQEVQQAGWLASARRDARLRQLLDRHRGELDVPGAASILRDRGDEGSVARRSLVGGINNAGTIVTAVFDPKALRMWAGMVGEDGTSADGRLHGFDLLSELGMAPRAAQGLADVPAMDVPPAEAEAWRAVWEAEYLQAKGRHEEVRRMLAPVLQRFPDSEAVLWLLARGAMYEGKVDEAGPYLDRLIALPEIVEPHHLIEAYYWLGAAAERAGDRDRAIRSYRSALDVPLDDVSGDDRYVRASRQRLERLGSPAPAPVGDGMATGSPAASLAERMPDEPIREVRIVGAARTDPAIVASRVALRTGAALQGRDVALSRQRLEQLGAFESTQVTPVPTGASGEGVDVVVRVHEGFGWYRDPVEWVAMTAASLAFDQELALSYHNLGGAGINVDGTYRLGSAPPVFHAGVAFPSPPALAGVIAPFEAALTWDEASPSMRAALGSEAGLTRSARVRQIGASAETIWTPELRTSLGAAWRHETWEDLRDGTLDGTGGGEQAAVQASASWSTVDRPAWPAGGTRLAVSTLYTASIPAAPFARVQASETAHLALDRGRRWVLSLSAAEGWASASTPFHRHFAPGRQTGLRIAAPALPSRAFASSVAEVSWEVVPSLRLALFAEAGAFAQDGPPWDDTASTVGGGLSVCYLTPVSVSVGAFVATDRNGSITWGMGF